MTDKRDPSEEALDRYLAQYEATPEGEDHARKLEALRQAEPPPDRSLLYEAWLWAGLTVLGVTAYLVWLRWPAE